MSGNSEHKKSKSLRVPLNAYGLTMELDTIKSHCQTPAHWHMCQMGNPIAVITLEGKWEMKPPAKIGTMVIKKAEKLTKDYREKIKEYYDYNSKYGDESYGS